MMTLQAKESISPFRTAGRPLRMYPADSPRAKARLIVLALLADGRVDPKELDVLTEQNVFAELGINKNDFVEVLYEFCADVSGLASDKGSYLVSPAALATMFDEVGDHREQQKLARLIFDLIRSDGHLAEGEARLLWTALDAWSLKLVDGIEFRRRGAAPVATPVMATMRGGKRAQSKRSQSR